MSGPFRNQLLVGDVRQRLAEIRDATVDCVITSPPYFQLRDYGVPGQIGLEDSVKGWADELLLALRGLARVLKPSGSLWLNLGDSYSRHRRLGAPAKGLLLGPERVLLGLAADGWIVRNKVIWAKTNPMPHCVADRLSNSYDVVYFLTRSAHYYFDLDAIRLPHRSIQKPREARSWPPVSVLPPGSSQKGSPNGGLNALKARGQIGHRLGKNPGDVWPLATGSYRGAHFATFPPALVERPLLATCPERICLGCARPFRRATSVVRIQHGPRQHIPRPARVHRNERRLSVYRELGQLRPACTCRAPSQPGVVLDPFFGAGTVGLVAEQHSRDWLGIELNPAYARLALTRIEDARNERAVEREAA